MVAESKNITIEVCDSIKPIESVWREFDTYACKERGKSLAPIYYTFYQTYTWNRFVEEYYTCHKRYFKRLEYLLVRREGVPVAIMPLRVTTFPNKKIEMTSWRTAGVCNVVTPYLFDEEMPEIMEALVAYMSLRYKGYGVRLYDMPVETPFVKALEQMPGVRKKDRDSFHIPLNEFGNFEDYYASLSKKLRHNIQTRSNHFTHGDLRWELKMYDRKNPPSQDEWLKIWRIFYYRKLQWNKKSINVFRRITCEWEARKEVKSGMKVASLEALDEARLFVYEINGEPAAFIFFYMSGDYIVVPKLAIDMRFRTHAPGILMLKEVLKWCYDNGVKDFDLCRGEEPYKQQMGAIKEIITRITRK